MVADIRLEIKGLKELNNLLNKLPDKIAKKPLQNALRAGGNVVVKAAKAKAPVDTGLLRDSIAVKQAKQKTGAVHYQVGVYQKIGKKRPFYAHMIEFGTSKMSPKPFMRPAWEETKAEVLRTFSVRLAKSITTEALKFGGLKPTKQGIFYGLK